MHTEVSVVGVGGVAKSNSPKEGMEWCSAASNVTRISNSFVVGRTSNAGVQQQAKESSVSEGWSFVFETSCGVEEIATTSAASSPSAATSALLSSFEQWWWWWRRRCADLEEGDIEKVLPPDPDAPTADAAGIPPCSSLRKRKLSRVNQTDNEMIL